MEHRGNYQAGGDRAASGPAAGAAAPGPPPPGGLTSASPLATVRLLLERSRASLSQSQPQPPLDALGLFRASLVR